MNRFVVLMCLALAALSGTSRGEAPRYTIRALDVLPGGMDSFALAINELGQVVGHSTLDRSGNVGQSRPVMWDANGQPQELWPRNDPFLLGGIPLGINNAGQVVGRYGAGSGIPLPGPGVPPGRAFIWDGDRGLLDLGTLGGRDVEAVAINESGQVAGSSETGSGTSAFIWDPTSGMTDLGNLGLNFSLATGINNRGQVVGYSATAEGHGRAFIWDRGTGIHALAGASGGSTRAFGINDLGDVVGTDSDAGAFFWNQNTGIRLLSSDGALMSFAWDINNLGQVVGEISSGGRVRPLLWDQMNGVRDLEGLLTPGLGWQLEQAKAINDKGQIVGHGYLNGQVRAFLMTPIPEPSSIVLAIIASLLVSMVLVGGCKHCRR